MSISTHVLDAVTGRPAAGVAVLLTRQTGSDWQQVAARATDVDGRIPELLADAAVGDYRLTFDSAGHFGGQTFYPEVIVSFRITDAAAHHHVPLLLSPYAYSTYRGS